MSISEEKIYRELLENAPQTSNSSATKQSAESLNLAESANPNFDYDSTYSGKVDQAINSWLNLRGLNYDPAQDKAYQQYRAQYESDSELARKKAIATANQLSGGYNPSFANAVSNEIYNDRLAGISDAEQTFKNFALQDYNARQNQLANIADIYNTLDSSNYSRSRDNISDYKNYLNTLAGRYITDRQSDIELQSADNDIYASKLSAAQSNLNDTRSINNSRYMFNTVSADKKAELEQAEKENSQKIAYEQAKNEYDSKVKAENEAQKSYYKHNNSLGSTYIDDYNLKNADYKFQLEQVAIGYYNGKLDLQTVDWIANKLGLDYDDLETVLDNYDQRKKASKEWQ